MCEQPRVLVVIGATYHKDWCKFLMPGIYNDLSYKNKDLLYVSESILPNLEKQPTGEQRAAAIRQCGIEYARYHDYDYILFLDCDVTVEPITIQRLLAVGHPLVGGAHAARGDSWSLIGHQYVNRQTLQRRPLVRYELGTVATVDGTSGGILLVAKSIFKEVDYAGYAGPDTLPGRFTADDEYLQISIFEKLNIKPKLLTTLKSWHYHDDGKKYQVWGKEEVWR